MLTPQETEELFDVVRALTATGKSVIFITHKLHEVLEIADRITILRRGKRVTRSLAQERPRRSSHG